MMGCCMATPQTLIYITLICMVNSNIRNHKRFDHSERLKDYQNHIGINHSERLKKHWQTIKWFCLALISRRERS